MNLYLVQHAAAFTKEQYADRPLTEQGCFDAQKTAKAIEPLKIPVHAVWHSGKTRALQTAKIFHAAVKSQTPLQIHDGLSPNDDPKPVVKEIKKLNKDILIVGHLPFLSRLAALLLTGDADTEPVAFQKAGIVCLRQNPEETWQLAWILTPEIL